MGAAGHAAGGTQADARSALAAGARIGTPASSQPKREFFTAHEWRTVRVLADDIIPRDARSGSATDAGVPEFIDFHLSVPETSEDTRLAGARRARAGSTRNRRKRFQKNYATLTRRAAPPDPRRHRLASQGQARDAARAPRSSPASATSCGDGLLLERDGLEGPAVHRATSFNPDWNGCPAAAMQKLGVSYDLMDTRIPVE